jgi:N-acyl-D-amino-acid deacylase
MIDLIIRNGTIIDGTGAARFPADIGIEGDRIVALERLGSAQAKTVIDATGKIVAPGFIDVHNHSEGWLLKLGHLPFKTRQGITTEILMSDGISYAPMTESSAPQWIYYLRALNALRFWEYGGWQSFEGLLQAYECEEYRVAQNVALEIPYANVRTLAMGWVKSAPDDSQMRHIQDEIRRGMEAGAVGLSTGLDYVAQCFSSTDELAQACSAMAARGGLYVTHVRYKKGTIAGVQEAVEICRRAGVPLHVSHLKCDKKEDVEPLLAAIAQAEKDVDFSFDVYPYVPGSSMLHMLLPYEVWEDGPLGVLPKLVRPEIRERVYASFLDGRNNPHQIRIAWLPSADNQKYIGCTLAEYAESIRYSLHHAVCDLLIEENLAVQVVFHRGEDHVVYPFLQHPKFMLGSDGIYAEHGKIHPRCCGSAPRLIGPLVRDKKLFTLEEAVRKMTGIAAQRFGLTDRGVLRRGAFADLVVFEPQTVADRATYESPYETPVGIEHVLVNGTPVIAHGEPVDIPRNEMPGRVLRYRE